MSGFLSSEKINNVLCNIQYLEQMLQLNDCNVQIYGNLRRIDYELCNPIFGLKIISVFQRNNSIDFDCKSRKVFDNLK